MQESRVPCEVAPKKFDDFQYEVSADGTTALIPVGDDSVHGIWKIPIAQLGWAREMMPVFLKRLPDLEPVEVARQRQIRHQSRYMKAKLTVEQRQSFEKELSELDEQIARRYTPVPRYCLMKWTERRDIPVHRLYVTSDDAADVEAIDGDYLNFCPVKVRIILGPVPDKDGIAGGRGETVESIIEVSNLQIVRMAEDHRQEHQTKFEDRMLQFKYSPQGDISTTPLRVMPNWDLGKRTGCHGLLEGDAPVIIDCGKSAPATLDERRDLGLIDSARCGRVGRARDKEADAIRRRWMGR
jgi:hypothetical protein